MLNALVGDRYFILCFLEVVYFPSLWNLTIEGRFDEILDVDWTLL